MDSDEVDDKQLDILDCNCVKTVKRFRASSRKISVLRTENSAVNTRKICLPSIYIILKFSMLEKLGQENPDHKLEIRSENPDLLGHGGRLSTFLCMKS